MKNLIFLLAIALFSCNSPEQIAPNNIEGDWTKLSNPNITITFDDPNFIYRYNGTASYYTYSLSNDTVVINNDGNITRKWYSVTGDTLRLENGNIIEKWIR